MNKKAIKDKIGLELMPRASVMIEAMRDIGYSFDAAVADIIDNGIAAGAKKIDLRYGWEADLPWIAVIDDGSGMSRDVLLEAMRPGSRDPRLERDKDDLGRFGLGLKTASFSQCRELTVVTRQAGVVHAMCWDLDHVAKTDRWEITELSLDEMDLLPVFLPPNADGTAVIWRKIDRLELAGLGEMGHDAFNELMASVRQHLERIFHRYLVDEDGHKEIRMAINGTAIEPYDPFAEDNIATQRFPVETVRIKNSLIRIEAFVLPHHTRSTAKEYERLAGPEGYLRNQGFYIYRNRRLILWGSWFKLARQEELTKLARVRIDIPNSLDYQWGIDVRKARAHPPLLVRNRLKQVIDQIRQGAKRPYTQRGRVVIESASTPVWTRLVHNDRIEYAINDEHPLIEDLLSDLGAPERARLRAVIRMLGQTFPAAAFFSDYASVPRQIESNQPELDALAELAGMLKKSNPGLDASSFASMLAGMQPFNNYPDQIASIVKSAMRA